MMAASHPHQIDARIRYRLLFGLTGVFLWPGFSGILVFMTLSGISGGSTEHQPRGYVASHGRMTRIDGTQWDLLRLFENILPVFGVLLAIACGISVYESRKNTIVRASGTLRGWSVLWMWLCVGLSIFVIFAPVAWVLIKR
jgi:hypothetical protein